MPSRRQIILGAGGGVALVGGGAFWRVSRQPEQAMAPWQIDKAEPSVRLDALRHAILAPSPHNRQPWLLRLHGKSDVIVSCDLDKRLPETDPFDRQITIGFGSFCELAGIAASKRGQRIEITPFPDGAPGPDERLDSRPVARLHFVTDPNVRMDPLAAMIRARRSTKEEYDLETRIADAPLDRIAALSTPDVSIAYANKGQRVGAIARNIIGALGVEMRTPRTNQESVDLMRIGADAIDAAPDGIGLRGKLIETLVATGNLTKADLADRTSSFYRQGVDQQLAIYGSVPAALWLVTPGNTRLDQFNAGRAYVRANLLATALGLKMHPASQALQEYPEMAEQLASIHHLLAIPDGHRIQMLARIGHGPDVPPAPRWPLSEHLRA